MEKLAYCIFYLNLKEFSRGGGGGGGGSRRRSSLDV